MDEIAQLLKQIPTQTGQQLGDRLYELSKLVKLYEGEAELEPVAAALPWLADYLCHGEQWNVCGCAISIFRRVDINQATANKLYQLQENKPTPLLLTAFSHIYPPLWQDRFEQQLSTALEDKSCRHHAANTLREQYANLNLPSTVSALAAALATTSTDKTYADCIISCLCQLCDHKSLGKPAQTALKQQLKSAPASITLSIIETIAWAWEKGDQLIALAADAPQAEVRLAVLNSLEQHFKGKSKHFDVAYQLSQDSDPRVRHQAKTMLR